MSKIDEFGQKMNIFEKRTQNKKYLAKKKRYNEKQNQKDFEENYFFRKYQSRYMTNC